MDENFMDFMKLEVAKRGRPFVIPEFMCTDGDPESVIDYLMDHGYLDEINGDYRPNELLRIDYPEIYELMEAMMYARLDSDLMQLVDLGFIEMFVNEQGESAYRLTEKGRAYGASILG